MEQYCLGIAGQALDVLGFQKDLACIVIGPDLTDPTYF